MWIRIRIPNTDPDPGSSWIRIQYGSNTDPDPQHCVSVLKNFLNRTLSHYENIIRIRSRQIRPDPDLRYYLRAETVPCQVHHFILFSVRILCSGQHEQAVELALTIHLDLAVRCAGGQLAGGPLSQDMSKKLWLRVAR